MKREKVVVLFFGLMLLINLVSAATTIHVKTLPRQDFYMTPIFVGEDYRAISPPQFYSSDEYGDLVIILENITTNQFSLFFTLKDDSGTTTFRKKIDTAFLTGTDVNVTVAPTDATLLETPTLIYYPDAVVNTTLTNLTNLTTSNSSNFSANLTLNSTVNDTNDSNPIVSVKKIKKSQLNESLINGNITDATTDGENNTLWYIIGAVVLVGILVFLFIGRKSGGRLSPYSRGIEAHYERELSKAKKEFKHAKDNLELLRGKKEIVAAERKIENDRKQLETLLAKENKKFK